MIDDSYKRRVSQWVDHFNWLVDRQVGHHQRLEHYWRRWHADPTLAQALREGRGWLPENVGRRAPSDRLRDWQTALVTPRGAINEMSRTAMMANLLAETQPFLRVRGWQIEDLRTERPIEALMNYMIAIRNNPINWTADLFRDAFVQGCAPLETRWVERWDTVDIPARPFEVARFTAAMRAALDAIDEARARGDAEAMDPPGIDEDGRLDWSIWSADNPASQRAATTAFAQWSAGVQQRYNITIPEPPFPRRARIAKSVGIELKVVSKLDLVWDFTVPDFGDVPVIYKVLTMNKGALLIGAQAINERLAARGQTPAFDLGVIQGLPTGLRASVGRGVHSYDSVAGLHAAALEVLGYASDASDPRRDDEVHVLEVWEPSAADGYRYCWIGQLDQPLTRRDYFPSAFAQHPFSLHQHISFMSMGKSAFDYDGPRHDVADRMLSRAIDFQALVAGSPIVREGGFGLEGRGEIEPRPFAFIDEPFGVKHHLLFGENMAPALQAATAAYNAMLAEIDESHGVGDVQRGGEARINRISAQEIETRAQAAQGRPKQELLRFGGMVSSRLAPLVAMLTWENGDPEVLANIMGGAEAAQALEAMTAESMLPAFQADYLTLVAVLEADLALRVQQFQETIKVGVEMGAIVPGKESARLVFQEQLRLSRSPIAVALAEASAKDAAENDQAQQAIQQLQGQVQQLQQQLQQGQQERALLLAESTSLRKWAALPTYETLLAVAAALQQGQAPEPQPERQQLAPGEPAAPEPGPMPQSA